MENIISEQIFQAINLFPEREVSFEKDFNDLFKKIENMQPNSFLTFQIFKSFWKETSLNYIIHSKDKREDSEEFYKMIYGLLLSKYFSCDNLNLNLACFFSLYIIFLSQAEFERVQININLNILKKINKMFKNALLIKNLDFKSIIQKLLNLQAFSFEYRTGIKTLLLSKYGTPVSNNSESIINELEKLKFNEEEEQKTKQAFELEELKEKCANYFNAKKRLKEIVKTNIEKNDNKKENEVILSKLDQSDSLLPNLIEFKFQQSLN